LNFSDHLPVLVEIDCRINDRVAHTDKSNDNRTEKVLRWDKGDIMTYYFYTGHHLQLLLNDLDYAVQDNGRINISDRIELIYNSVVAILADGARLAVPSQSKSFYKYWWDEELDLLKQASIDSNNIWTAAGKPRSGPIFSKRQSCRRQYRLKIKEKDSSNTGVYTNELHEALLNKNGTSFWRVWRSKFESSNKVTEVDGCVDNNAIAVKFAEYFSNCYACNNPERAADIEHDCASMRACNLLGLSYV